MEISSKFDLVVRYRPGKSNANADALSRNFPGQTEELVTNTV